MTKKVKNTNPAQETPIETVRSYYDELVRSIRFLGDVSVTIHGLRDENEIYRTLLDEFGKYGMYDLSIMLLTSDKSHIRVFGNTLSSKKLKAAEKAAGLRQRDLLIDLDKSYTYSRVIKDGKIVKTDAISIMKEILPEKVSKLVPMIAKLMGYAKKKSVVLPIYTNDNIIGAIGISPPEMFEDFIPSAENFSRQVSAALDLAHQTTKHKEAKEKKNESEERYRSFINNFQGIAFRGRIKDFTPVFFHGAVKKITGYTAKEFMAGKPCWDQIVHPEDMAFYMKQVEQAISSPEESSSLEHRIICNNGEIRWIHQRSHFILDDKGKPLYVDGTLYDITKRKAVEYSFQENQDILIKAQKITHIGHFKFNPKTQTVEGSDELFDIFGLTREEFQFSNFVNAVHPDDRKFDTDTISSAIENSTCYDIEHRLLLPDGTLKYVRAIGETILDSEGATSLLIGTVQDITQQKQTENELRENEENYRMLFDEMLDGFALHEMIFDKAGKPVDYRFLSINPAFTQMTGMTPEMAIGKTVLEVIPDTESYWIETYGKVTMTGEPVRFQNYADALKKHFDITAFRPKEGQFACIFTDISGQKQLEDQLRQSEKMRAIGQLAGGIAHDFNNQLGGILGYADLLREEVGDNATLSRYTDNILISVRRSADLTAQLLAFSRQGKYQDVMVDIHNIIHEVVSILQHSIDKRIVVSQLLKASPPTTTGDPTQLQNAILNLALNARDAMPKGGELIFSTENVQVDDSYKRSSSFEITNGYYIQLCVTDSGTGMDKETQKHVFEPFYTTKEEGKGTGMGLAAVYGTIKNHQGFVHIYSEEGKGSTFKVYLPLVESEILHSEANGISKPAKTGAGHILLVEDDKMLRDAASAMIEKLGYELTVCADGKDAVTFYKKSWKEVDLVLLDMVMPVMNGRDTFIAMQKINPKIVALLSSGYSFNGEAKSILKEGVRGFIQKPYRKAELAEKIAELLNK